MLLRGCPPNGKHRALRRDRDGFSVSAILDANQAGGRGFPDFLVVIVVVVVPEALRRLEGLRHTLRHKSAAETQRSSQPQFEELRHQHGARSLINGDIFVSLLRIEHATPLKHVIRVIREKPGEPRHRNIGRAPVKCCGTMGNLGWAATAFGKSI